MAFGGMTGWRDSSRGGEPPERRGQQRGGIIFIPREIRPMAKTVSDLLIDRLIDWGVSVIFGFPGDGNNGIMEALRKRQDKVRFVQVRHEEGAAFMACAYAKFTGRLG